MELTIDRLSKYLNRTQLNGDCLEWTGCKRGGYALVTVNNKSYNLHRYLYELVYGAIASNPSDPLVVDHLCRNRACIKINHLELVTNSENLRRGLASKTHCANGHAYNSHNVRINKYTGHRYCRLCNLKSKREYQRRYMEAKRAIHS